MGFPPIEYSNIFQTKGNVLHTANKQEMESFLMEWQEDLIAFETKIKLEACLTSIYP